MVDSAVISPEVIAAIVGHGPAASIIVILIAIIRYIFKRWDADRERLIVEGQRFAEVAWASAKALEISNRNADSMVAAIQTMKLLAEMDRTRA